MVLTLLYALITFCAVMITLGMVLLAITLSSLRGCDPPEAFISVGD